MSHWLYVMWFSYFWPSLKGNGPEAIVQTVLYGAIAYFLVPPVREYINEHMRKLHEKVDHSHALMQHIIKNHPDIPDFEETSHE